MKKKDLQDLKNKSEKDLEKIAQEKSIEVATLRTEIALARHKNVRSAKIARLMVARAKTLLAQKKGVSLEA
jgi:ribosomal protein L29